MKKVLLKIDGMTCSACSSGLEKYLNKQEGIKQATVNLIMNNANIEYDDKKLTLEQVEKFVEKAGFTSLGIDNFEKEEKKKTNEKYKLIAITIISILVLYISMSHMVGMPVISFLDMMTHPANYAISLFILTTIVLILGKDIIKNGYKNLIHKTPNMDTLVMIGVLSSYIYSIYGTIQILKGHVMHVESLYYESAAIVIFFIEIGRYVENKNKDKTKEALQQLMSITPNNAVILRDGQEITVTLDEIQKGDIVVSKPGEKIAVDGIIIKGKTHTDESFITGESKPVSKKIGDKVIAGSVNYDGHIKYKAERIGKDSSISNIVTMVVEATNTKAPIARVADKISGYFVPIIFIIALIAFIVNLVLIKNINDAILALVSVLVVACPCALGLATPLAMVVAIGNCSKNGILVKSSEILETTNKIDTIVFDKTGTLTYGKLRISEIKNYSNYETNKILQLVGSIESKSTHPIGKAFQNYLEENKIEKLETKEFKNITGLGIIGKIEDYELILGNSKILEEYKIKNESKIGGIKMEFFDKLGKKASEAYKVTADKTGKLAKEAKLRMKISDLKSQINTIYKEIGETVYQKHTREGEYDITKEIEEKCTKIDVLSDEIESNLKQCLELKDKRQCPSCFAEIEKDVKFCPKCGAKQEEIQEEPAKEVEVIEKAEEQKENNQEDEKSTLETTVEVESNSNLDDDKTVEHISEEE